MAFELSTISFKNIYLEVLNYFGLKVHLHTAFSYCYKNSIETW